MSSGPILEFKGSVRYTQKRHPNMVTQIDMFLQNLSSNWL